jgi:hypothetical protein
MGAPVDVIISAFATPGGSGKQAIAQPKIGFATAPLVIGVDPIMQSGEGLASPGFARAADQLKRQDASGSILKALLRSRAKGYDVQSVTLVGFSAGNIFLGRVLETADWEWVDSVICLDGMIFQKLWNGAYHMPSVEPWLRFGEQAALNRRLFVNSFTDIASHSAQVTPTREAGEAMMSMLVDRLGRQAIPNVQTDLAPLTGAPPPPAVKITSQNTTREWETMPLPEIQAIGNAWNLYYGGTGGPDHIFQANYVQGALWHTFLQPRMNSGIHCAMPTAGLGAEVQECSADKVVLPPGTIPTDSPWPSLFAMMGGLALGAAAGYYVAR